MNLTAWQEEPDRSPSTWEQRQCSQDISEHRLTSSRVVHFKILDGSDCLSHKSCERLPTRRSAEVAVGGSPHLLQLSRSIVQAGGQVQENSLKIYLDFLRVCWAPLPTAGVQALLRLSQDLESNSSKEEFHVLHLLPTVREGQESGPQGKTPHTHTTPQGQPRRATPRPGLVRSITRKERKEDVQNSENDRGNTQKERPKNGPPHLSTHDDDS